MSAKENKKITMHDTLISIDSILNKTYLPNLTKVEIKETDEIDKTKVKNENATNVTFVSIKRIVISKTENIRDKLVNVFKSFSNVNGSLIFYLNGSKEKNSYLIDLCVGIKGTRTTSSDLIINSLKGNFPGIEFEKLTNNDDEPNSLEKHIVNKIRSATSITTVTTIPALRDDNVKKQNADVQGIEKLIDGMIGMNFSMLIIADPINSQNLSDSKKNLENIYSELIPYLGSTVSYGISESETISENMSDAVTDSITESMSESISKTIGKTETDSSSHGETKQKAKSALSGLLGATGAVLGNSLFPGLGAFVGNSIGNSIGGMAPTYSDQISKSISKNESETKTKAVNVGKNKGETISISFGNSFSSNKSKNVQVKFENYTVKRILSRIETQLKRYDECSDLGMWNCAAYFLSGGDNSISNISASIYQSLMRGKNSGIENGAIVNWTDKNKLNHLKNSLLLFEHPSFTEVKFTMGTLISSEELAVAAGFPKHSVPGISITENASFGRNISEHNFNITENNENKTIDVGKIFHMGNEEEQRVQLKLKNFTAHAFITGSTGSGKSTAIYKILSEAYKNKIKFLVIEPAKGEYRKEFLGVNTYGTNLKEFNRIITINPFSFPDEIHITEHIDRLVEIFNACWPMYAAMPAVLKHAILKSYEDCGWNITSSIQEYGRRMYPCISDVISNVNCIINSSEYDSESKGGYKGALSTRLKDLTHNVFSQIFIKDDDQDFMEKLFGENSIVDLSHIGSIETKALIMGMLVLKLQEYRVAERKAKNIEENTELKHLTVLEEAHNLLRKCSTDQSSESVNITGKSVEMISNVIAEMRTYGEGFIIADQAPGLLDASVIRNTNTKIILRLPDYDDRTLVGKSANLNEEQILELARLKTGVAAIYQNNWIQPVLCKIDEVKSDDDEIKNLFEKTNPPSISNCNDEFSMYDKKVILELLFESREFSDIEKDNILNMEISNSLKVSILNSIKGNDFNGENLNEILPLTYEKIKKEILTNPNNKEQWVKNASAVYDNEVGQIIDDEFIRNKTLYYLVEYFLTKETNDVIMFKIWANQFKRFRREEILK